jgi:uncharacterized protein (DUF1778 family)
VVTEAESFEQMVASAGGRKPRPPKTRKGRRRTPRPPREKRIRYKLSPETSRAILEAAAHTKQSRRYVAEVVFEEIRKVELGATKDLVKKVGVKMLNEALAREDALNKSRSPKEEEDGA